MRAEPVVAAIEQVYDGTKRRFQGKDLEAVVKNERNGKSTRLRVEEIDLSADLHPDRFTVEALKGGW